MAYAPLLMKTFQTNTPKYIQNMPTKYTKKYPKKTDVERQVGNKEQEECSQCMAYAPLLMKTFQTNTPKYIQNMPTKYTKKYPKKTDVERQVGNKEQEECSQ